MIFFAGNNVNLYIVIFCGNLLTSRVLNPQVTDEEGRRRFHGAFTGGYSAGYYNTVGSKEGKILNYLIVFRFPSIL